MTGKHILKLLHIMNPERPNSDQTKQSAKYKNDDTIKNEIHMQCLHQEVFFKKLGHERSRSVEECESQRAEHKDNSNRHEISRSFEVHESQRAEHKDNSDREGIVNDKDFEKSKKCVMFSVGVMVLCRVLRAWNRTGDKWAHLPDIGDWLVRYVAHNVMMICLTKHAF